MNRYERNIREDTKPTHQAKAAMFAYGGAPEFAVTYTPITAGVFNIYLFGLIEEATQFISAIEVMQQASEQDVVIVHLSTDGGSLDATDSFITAMHECAAKVVVKASGGVHSAGTKILLACDEFYLSDNFNALIHNGSCGAGGKTSDFRAQSKHTLAYMDRVMHETYEGFMTEEEIQQLIDGKDFWFDGDEFLERSERRNDILAQQQEAAQESFAQALAVLAETTPKKAKGAKEAPIQ